MNNLKSQEANEPVMDCTARAMLKPSDKVLPPMWDMRPDWLKTPEAAQPKVKATIDEIEKAYYVDELYNVYMTYEGYFELASMVDGNPDSIYNLSKSQLSLIVATEKAYA